MSSQITQKQSLANLIKSSDKLYKKWAIKSTKQPFTTRALLVKGGVDTSAGDNGIDLTNLAKHMTASSWQKDLSKFKHNLKADTNSLYDDFTDYVVLNGTDDMDNAQNYDYIQYNKLKNSSYPYKNFTYQSAKYLIALLGNELLDYTVNVYW